jgi:hypothetical protein
MELFASLVRWAVAHRDQVHERAAEVREQVLQERTVEANLWRWQEALHGTPATASRGPHHIAKTAHLAHREWRNHAVSAWPLRRKWAGQDSNLRPWD